MLKTKTANFKTQVMAACKRIATPALFLCTIVSLEAQATGSVRGKVIDSANGEPMIGVTAVIKGLGVYGVTDIDGSYVIPNVPAGKHTVVYQIMGYQTSSTSVNVGGGGAVRANITMNYKVSTEVVVTAKRIDNTSAALLSKRKKAAAAQDAISAEQISKSPDSDAGEAAKRVTGITVVDGKYVYVRGLGERYSSVQYNGSTIPSPNPDKRVIPLDIFPAALLDNLVVTKTYTVDLPAEFSGGLVQINPKDYPEEKEVRVSIGTGFNSVTTGKTFYGSQGGATDFWGFDDGTRALPSGFSDGRKISLANTAFNPNGYSATEIESLGESFKRTWDINKTKGIMPANLQASFGNTYHFSEKVSMGLVAAGLARESSETIADKTYKTYFSPGSPRFDYKQNISTYATTKGGLLGLAFALGKHDKIRLNSFYSSNTEDTVQETNGKHPDYSTDIHDVRIKYNVYGLWFTQLNGEHLLPWLLDSKFTWKSSYSRATFEQPDYRSYTQLTTASGGYSLIMREDSPSRVFTSHLDQTVDVQPELAIPFSQWNGLKSTIALGGYFSYRDRGSKTRRFNYTSNSAPASFFDGNMNDVMIPEHIAQASGTGFGFQEITGPNDSYRGEQQITAGYSQLDLPLIPSLRFERSRIIVTTYDIYAQGNPTKAVLTNNNVVPGVNLIYSITPDINLRTAYSLTVSRPDFRELTPFLFLGAAGTDVVKGNSELKQAQIGNYDLRLEWFPGVGEVIAASAFFKDLQNPVEVTELASSDVIVSYRNVPKAYLIGGELEIHKNLGFISKAIDELSIFGNYSYIKSEVSLPTGGYYTNSIRPLQGQSPYIFNVGASYDRVPWQFNLTLLYNIYGRRIVRVGAGGLEDTYEEPVGKFDAVVKKGFGKWGSLKATAANILNARYYATQGSDIRFSYYRGVTYSLSYELKF
jgi:TonB-dependent receptor